VDDSNAQIHIHTWKHSSSLELERGSLVAIKTGQLKTNTFQNVTSTHLALNAETLFWADPDLHRAKELGRWMNNQLASLN